MSTFQLYLELGINHIINLEAYDHILFIVALCAVYHFNQWRQVLVLVTAFTLGHTTTLALASFNVIHFPSKWIEFFIAVTIFITAVANIVERNDYIKKKTHWMKYGFAMFFGLIHGLGFSFYLRSLLGREANIITSLFGFNLGIEIGQICIVLIVLTLTYIFVDVLKLLRREWNLVLSGAGIGVSLMLMLQRIPWR